MEKQNRVSLWVGNLLSENELDEIMLEVYDEKGDSSSKFMESFKIEYIDNQFQEVFYYEDFQTKEEIFEGFSYVDSFINKIPEIDWTEKNSIILFYNFEYNKNVTEKLGLKFIDTYDYIED
jgi:hypothetical protein